MAERIVLAGLPGFQWHCADLAGRVVRADPTMATILDRYELDLILKDSEHLQPLGRLIWRSGKYDLGRRPREKGMKGTFVVK